MSLTVNYIERKIAVTQSIEGVFRQVAKEIEKSGLIAVFSKLPFTNSFVGLIKNLLFYRPETADIYHITGDVHYIALVLPKSRTVLTIHDLLILQQRKGLRRWLLKKINFDLPIRRAGAVTVISEATKIHLVKETGIDPSRVTIIENPLKDGLSCRQKPEFNSLLPRLLHIGTYENKNLDNLIKAVRGLTCCVVIVGALSNAQIDMLAKADVEYENFIGLDDKAMQEQYLLADMLVFCSKFEGFGLPIIEAQAMKTPVITSDLSPMREVAGNGAILVDPENAAAIRGAIERVIEDTGLRARLVEQGLENIKRFDAAKIAERYISVYKDLVDRRVC